MSVFRLAQRGLLRPSKALRTKVFSLEELNHAVLSAAELLQPVVKALAKELRAGDYIQADETTLACQGAGRPASKNFCKASKASCNPTGMGRTTS